MTERDRGRGEDHDPLDEEAAWAEIVAGYGERPPEPETAVGPGPAEAGQPPVWHPDAVPDHPAGAVRDAVDDAAGTGGEVLNRLPEDTALNSPDAGTGTEPAGNASAEDPNGAWDGPGPRDWAPEEEGDEGHFVPPDPPPLPESDLITRGAWLAVIGGPLLLVGCAILDIDVTWWITLAGVGGFLGGFATLVLGMRDDRDDEWTDPGSGAVV